MTEPVSRDPRSLWQGQAAQEALPRLEDVRRRATAFERTIRRRNLREYLASLFVVVFFGWQVVARPEPTARIGAALLVAGTLFVVTQLARRGSAAPAPADAALRPCLEFHRRELERQRDLLRGVWAWYLLPLVPGLVVMLGGRVVTQPGSLWRVVPFALLCAAMFLGIGWLNLRAARELQREIDELEVQT